MLAFLDWHITFKTHRKGKTRTRDEEDERHQIRKGRLPQLRNVDVMCSNNAITLSLPRGDPQN